MSGERATELSKLSQLRSSGAITEEQYRTLVDSLGREQAGPSSARPNRGAPMLQVATAAAGGALAGSLAGDLLQQALADPPPEIVEGHLEMTTTWTEDGYVTEGEIIWENADGEIVAEETFVEEGTFTEEGALSDEESFVDQGPEDSGGFPDVEF